MDISKFRINTLKRDIHGFNNKDLFDRIHVYWKIYETFIVSTEYDEHKHTSTTTISDKRLTEILVYLLGEHYNDTYYTEFIVVCLRLKKDTIINCNDIDHQFMFKYNYVKNIIKHQI